MRGVEECWFGLVWFGLVVLYKTDIQAVDVF
jgi:hypothetical protein